MRKPVGLGWKIAVSGFVMAIPLYLFARALHLSTESSNIILATTIMIPIVLGLMVIAESRKARRTENSAWNYIEESEHYL